MAGADPQTGCRAYNRPKLQPMIWMFVGSSLRAARKVLTRRAHAHQALSLMEFSRILPFVLRAAISGLQLMDEFTASDWTWDTVLTAGAGLTR